MPPSGEAAFEPAAVVGLVGDHGTAPAFGRWGRPRQRDFLDDRGADRPVEGGGAARNCGRARQSGHSVRFPC